MSKLTGGLFSRPSGKNSGLVFSSARTSRGKKATARNYVIPTQPDSPGQLETKYSIRSGARTYRQLPKRIAQVDLKKISGAVSGFVQWQKMMFPVLKIPPFQSVGPRVFGSGDLELPSELIVGTPGDSPVVNVSWTVDVNWKNEPTDKLVIILVRNSDNLTVDSERQVFVSYGDAVRSDGFVQFPILFDRGNIIYISYFVSQDGSLVSPIQLGTRGIF